MISGSRVGRDLKLAVSSAQKGETNDPPQLRVLEFAPDLPDGVLAESMPLDSAYETAKSRKVISARSFRRKR